TVRNALPCRSILYVLHTCRFDDVFCIADICFFFSSRRRHTISTRDWSSDVCSSDLQSPGTGPFWYRRPPRPRKGGSPTASLPRRSEERRVGKECESTRAASTRREKELDGWTGECSLSEEQ